MPSFHDRKKKSGCHEKTPPTEKCITYSKTTKGIKLSFLFLGKYFSAKKKYWKEAKHLKLSQYTFSQNYNRENITKSRWKNKIYLQILRHLVFCYISTKQRLFVQPYILQYWNKNIFFSIYSLLKTNWI